MEYAMTRKKLLETAVGLAALLAIAPPSAGQVPDAVSYQGVLIRDGIVAADGLYTIRFAIYDNPTSGSPLYTTTPSLQVQVKDGLYNVILAGAGATAAFDGPNRYVQVALVNGPGITSEVTLLPRHQLTAAPFAMRAAKADLVINTPWMAPVLTNGWVEIAPGQWGPLRSHRDPGGVVHLEGIIQGAGPSSIGTIANPPEPWRTGAYMFTLPSGHAPAIAQILSVTGCCDSSAPSAENKHFLATIYVGTDGVASLRHAERPILQGAYLILDGVSFRGAP